MNLRTLIYIVAICLGTGLIVWALIHFKPEAEKKESVVMTTAVNAVRVEPSDVTLTLTSQGEIEADLVTQAASEVAGRVIAVSPAFEAGGRFEKGDVLLEIDPTDYEAAVAQAESNLADATLALQVEVARAEQSKRDWEKLRSNEEPTALVLRDPQLASAEAKVSAAQATLEKALQDVERTKLKAPYRGRVSQTYTDLASFVTVGGRLADLYSDEVYEVRLPLSLEDYAFLKEPTSGEASEITLKVRVAGERHEWKATFDRNEGQIDRASRSVYIVARVEREPGTDGELLVPGLFVNAELGGKTLSNVFEVPRRAMRDLNHLVTIDEEDRLHLREVEVIRQEFDTVVISEGLQAGDRVCTTNLPSVVEGMKVEVNMETEESPEILLSP